MTNSSQPSSKMVALFFFFILCFFLPAKGDTYVQASAVRGSMVCTAGAVPFTENTGIALQDVISPSIVLKQERNVSTSEECRKLCCEIEGCNVASFISVDDVRVCALVKCVDNLSCLWQSYANGAASFLEPKIDELKKSAPQEELTESSTVPLTNESLKAESNFVTPTTEVTEFPSSTQPVATSTSSADEWEAPWWMNPLNWGRPPKDYEDEDMPGEFDDEDSMIDDILNEENDWEENDWEDNYRPSTNDLNNNNYIIEDEQSYSDSDSDSSESAEDSPMDKKVENLQTGETMDDLPPGGITSGDRATSWLEHVPHHPLEDDTTYSVGLAVFLASLGLAGVLVLTIHFISKSRQKSRYRLLEVDEEMPNDKQPFLPK